MSNSTYSPEIYRNKHNEAQEILFIDPLLLVILILSIPMIGYLVFYLYKFCTRDGNLRDADVENPKQSCSSSRSSRSSSRCSSNRCSSSSWLNLKEHGITHYMDTKNIHKNVYYI
eukprot:GFUD01078632.1.p1 GENE.GFUD01078632.1~~GFUD01078632.1.p1  ORF type:complete len:115 (-),score=13.02 GFUD01078632.1:11-355(-)